MAEQSRIPGNIIVYNYAESSGRCSYRQVTNAFNPVGHLFLNFFGFARAIGTNNPYALVSNAHPVWHTGANPNLQLKDAFSSFPVALFAPNATVLLTYPTQNVFLQGLHDPSWLQTNYAAIALGVVGMIVACWKLSVFTHSFGIQLSIPQVVLACCFLSSFFIFLVYGLFGVLIGNSQAIVPFDAQEALSFMHIGFTFTGMIVLGFYFTEVSQLTSSQAVTGLSKLKIPAGVVIAILWIVII